MKKFNKYMSFGLASVMGLGLLASCDNTKDNDYVSMGNPNEIPDVYFPFQEAASEFILNPSDNSFIFNIDRKNTSGSLTVNLEWSGETSYFNLPTSATFTDGAEMCPVEVVVDLDKIETNTPYNLTVTLSGYPNSNYTQNYMDFVLSNVPMSDWEPFGYDPSMGRYGYGAYTFNGYYAGVEYPVLVESRYSLEDTNQIEYRFSWLIDNNDPSLGFETFLTANSDDGGQTINVPEQPFAYNDQYGVVYVSNFNYYPGAEGNPGGYFDEETGTFNLLVIYYVAEGYFGYGYETCSMDGYADPNDYTLTLSDEGSINVNDVNYQIITMHWTETVGMVRYQVFQSESLMENGEISDEIIEEVANAISEGEVPSYSANQQGAYKFNFAQNGDYTLVAVGYKVDASGSATMKTYASLNFTYENVDPNEGWTSLGYLEYTDGYMCSLFNGVDPLTYYVEVQESDEYDNYYRLVDPYGEAYPYNDPGDWDDSVHSYLYFDAEVTDCVIVDYSPQTIDWGYGPLTCYSYAAFILSNGGTLDDVYAEDANGVLKDGEITFPYKSLLALLGSDGWYYANMYGDDGAPFCINFNTLTTDPMAAAASYSTRASFSKSMNKVSLSNSGRTSIAKKAPRTAKFKSEKANNGTRSPYRTSPIQGGLR